MFRRGVASTNGDTQLGQAWIERANLGEWNRQVLLDVARQCFQRRDVQHLRLLAQFVPRGEQPVDRGEERGQGLSRARWRSDQRVLSGANRRPALTLRRRRLTQSFTEPTLDR